MPSPPPGRILGPVHHLGLVVADCEAAAAFYGRVWGLRKVRFFEYHNAQSRIWGEPAEYSLKIALGELAPGLQLELLEILSGNAIHREMRDKAGSGVNHIAFTVENLDLAMKATFDAGFDLALEPGWKRPNVAYLDTQSCGGIFIELYERGFGH